jgi:large subunit ribosomal protein L30
MSVKNKVSVRQLKSGAGQLPAIRATLKGLGLRGIRKTVELEDTQCVRGMIYKVSHLIEIVEQK